MILQTDFLDFQAMLSSCPTSPIQCYMQHSQLDTLQHYTLQQLLQTQCQDGKHIKLNEDPQKVFCEKLQIQLWIANKTVIPKVSTKTHETNLISTTYHLLFKQLRDPTV